MQTTFGPITPYELTPAPHFDPPERITSQILADLSRPSISLSEIADKAKTTIESLTLWLARPDIAARMDALESTFGRRCRLQLADNTGCIINACKAAINNYTLSESHMLFRDNDLRGHALMVKKASNALLASRILLHLAKHFTGHSARDSSASGGHAQPAPTHPTPPTPESPAPTNTREDTEDLAPFAPHKSRFTVLPPLTPITFNSHSAPIDPSHPDLPRDPTTPNPTRDNTPHTPPSPVPVPRVAGMTPKQSESPAHAPITSPTRSDTSPATREVTEGPSRAPAQAHPCDCDRFHPCRGCKHPVDPSLQSTLTNPTSQIEHRARDPTLTPA